MCPFYRYVKQTASTWEECVSWITKYIYYLTIKNRIRCALLRGVLGPFFLYKSMTNTS